MIILTAGFMAILLFFVYGLDDWQGILAFKHQYLSFCVLVAAAWLTKSVKDAINIITVCTNQHNAATG
ncbi:MAG: hypothetical protein GY809_05000 [Planctomycetes bacterium]|nr:hypothetical protein [Planctomycetota bacterium]